MTPPRPDFSQLSPAEQDRLRRSNILLQLQLEEDKYNRMASEDCPEDISTLCHFGNQQIARGLAIAAQIVREYWELK